MWASASAVISKIGQPPVGPWRGPRPTTPEPPATLDTIQTLLEHTNRLLLLIIFMVVAYFLWTAYMWWSALKEAGEEYGPGGDWTPPDRPDPPRPPGKGLEEALATLDDTPKPIILHDPDRDPEVAAWVDRDGRPHDCGPYCEHPGQNGIHRLGEQWCERDRVWH